MIAAFKRRGRRYPALRRLWGKLRWYTSRAGQHQLATAIGHIGWSVTCPFCGWHGNAFYPNPPPQHRPNALCPRCGSKERNRALFFYLLGGKDLLPASARVLEIAPGDYSHRFFRRRPEVTFVGLDLSAPSADVRGDIGSLPFPSGSFDLVLCSHVLEHVMDDHGAMLELRRVVRDRGLVVVQVPVERDATLEDPTVVDRPDRLRLYGQGDHVRAYGPDIEFRLRRAGFSVSVQDVTVNLSAARIARHGLVRGETVYTCSPHSAAHNSQLADQAMILSLKQDKGAACLPSA